MPIRSSWSRMCGTAAAASGVLTVMRTISEPATASSLTWIAVPIASTVSVLVMDCTRTGASPPMVTTREPQRTLACRERRGAGRAGSTKESRAEVSSRMVLTALLLQFEPGHVVARERLQLGRLTAKHQRRSSRVADSHLEGRDAVDTDRLAGANQARHQRPAAP